MESPMQSASNSLTVGFLSLDIKWHQPEANVSIVDKYLEKIDADIDVFILPEMFSTGFTMKASEVAEQMDGPTISWMRNKAKKIQSLICGSIVIADKVVFHNRFVAAFPNGDIVTYDKKYLFKLSGEHVPYKAGIDRTTFDYMGWRICPRICYDLRFPEWSRNESEYDVLVYVANWPTPRINHWDALLQARAIENQAYVIGVNRIGSDENGLQYPGHSSAYAYDGERMEFDEEQERMVIVQLQKGNMHAYREKLPFLNDR